MREGVWTTGTSLPVLSLIAPGFQRQGDAMVVTATVATPCKKMLSSLCASGRTVIFSCTAAFFKRNLFQELSFTNIQLTCKWAMKCPASPYVTQGAVSTSSSIARLPHLHHVSWKIISLLSLWEPKSNLIFGSKY